MIRAIWVETITEICNSWRDGDIPNPHIFPCIKAPLDAARGLLCLPSGLCLPSSFPRGNDELLNVMC